MAKSSVWIESLGGSSLGSVIAVLGLAASALGCGSSTDEPTTTNPPGEVPPAIGPGTMPCNISTGYKGDDACIQAPDPAVGMQLHYGPKDYTNQAEVARYLLMPGEEKTDCVFVKTTNDSVVYFNEYHGRMRPGSHHMLLYVRGETAPDSIGPENCRQGLDTRNLFGAQTEKIDVKALAGASPEYQGLAVKLEPHLQGVVQMHFINTGTEPILREGWANFIYTPESEVKMLGDPIFFIGARISVPPGATQVIKGMVASYDALVQGVPSPPPYVNLVGGTGHFHANTVRFSAWKVSSGQRELLIEDYDWHEPSLVQFNSTKKNPAPDAQAKTAGGYSGIVSIGPGETIEWECEIVNKTNPPVTLTFGNEVYTKEMCNMFGMYTPTVGGAWRNSAF